MESIKELREICQAPTRATEIFYIKFICRRFSIFITKFLLCTPVTANQVTFSLIIIGLFAGLFFLSSKPVMQLIGVGLLHFSFILDCVDGEIARYKKETSAEGKYFDYMAHLIVYPYIFSCITLGLYMKFRNLWIFAFGFSAILSIYLIYLSKSIKCFLNFKPEKQRFPQEEMHSISNNSFKKDYLRRFVRNISVFTGVTNILTLVVILDFLMQNLRLFPLNLNFLSIFLIFYGVFLPYFWIKTIYNNLKS